VTAALRAWGIVRIGVVIVGAVLLVETTATDQLVLPGVDERINGWALVPALVAMTLCEPLVDRSPELTELATRSPVVVALARLLLVHAGAATVAGYCLLSPEGVVAAQWVVASIAVATGAAALLGPWYWASLLPLSFAWLQHAAGDFPRQSFAIPAAVLVGLVLGTVVVHVGATLVREEAQRRR
jgi:hypothetical protein